MLILFMGNKYNTVSFIVMKGYWFMRIFGSVQFQMASNKDKSIFSNFSEIEHYYFNAMYVQSFHNIFKPDTVLSKQVLKGSENTLKAKVASYHGNQNLGYT